MFNTKYLSIKKLVECELTEIEKNMVSDISVQEPLNSHIKNFLLSPSKRIRSVLTLLYLKSQGLQISQNQINLLSAIETVHNASLIHDDIIDESDFRRGQKTISYDFGTKMGVISGDYLLAIAMKKIAELNNSAILQIFSTTLRQMCLGEINQNFDRFKIGTIESYIEKSKNKTGYLFETAILCSEILANINNLNEFGLNVGIAFQIRDDLLNILKKDNLKPSTDIQDGIYTAPIIYSQSVENYSSGIEKTRNLLNNYIDKAKGCIENFEPNIYKNAITELLESLKNV